MDTALLCIILLAAVAVYFIPSFVARMRHHHNENAIVIINFFLGWTFIGWVVALAWAFSSQPAQPVEKTPT